MTMRHRRWIQGAVGCALLATATIALGVIGLYSWINSMSIASQSLKATVLSLENELVLTCEDAQGDHLEILEVVIDPELQSDDGRATPLSGPRLSTDGRQVTYDWPDGIDLSAELTIKAPDGWAMSALGPLPALRDVPLKGRPRQARERVTSTPGSRPKPRAAHQEIQSQTRFTLHSARVVASGRAIQLDFVSEEPPADPTTFVDRHLSRMSELKIAGSRPRRSLNFAGATSAQGQDAIYRMEKKGQASAVHTGGEDLYVYSGETQIGTIEAFAQGDEKLGGAHPSHWVAKELGRILHERLDGSELAARFLLKSPAERTNQTPAESQSQTYRLTITGSGGPITTDPILYEKPKSGGTEQKNAQAAVQALRQALGYDGIRGMVGYGRYQDIQLAFDRKGCPVWPIQGVTVTDASHPDLLEPEAEPELVMAGDANRDLRNAILWFHSAGGCRDLDLSIKSSEGEEGGFHDCLRLWRAGDGRYRWSVTWYLDDPEEVIPFGESLTVSGPPGLVRGGRLDVANQTTVFSGDETAGFTQEPVQNDSWAGPDGDLSEDLCWVEDPSLGVSNGWGRWRREPPPAEWVRDSAQARSRNPEDQPPIRIAYVDEDYDGSNGPPRLNDPSRPYRLRDISEREFGSEDLHGGIWYSTNELAEQTPRLILLKRGQTHTTSDEPHVADYIENPFKGAGASFESPSILSTYWMDSDGEEPGEPTIFQGRIRYLNASSNRTNGPRYVIFHGLTFHGDVEALSPIRDYAVWDCVFPPWPGRHSGITWHISHRCSLIRTTVTDRWAVSGHTGGLYASTLDEALLDQTTWIRNGGTGFSGGWDGELRDPNNPDETNPEKSAYKPSYMDVLGKGPEVTLTRSHPNSSLLSHNIYVNMHNGGENLVLNSFGVQTTGVSFMFRSSALFYGCAHYKEPDYEQMSVGDQSVSRRRSTHSRRNLFLRSQSPLAIHANDWETNDTVASTVKVIEDNLLLEPTSPSSGIEVLQAGALAGTWHQVIRHNTLVDRRFIVRKSSEDSPPAPYYHLTALRNLLIHTGGPASRDHLVVAPRSTWLPGLINQNLYASLEPYTNRGFKPEPGSIQGFTAWQAETGWDSQSVYQEGGLEMVTPLEPGGRDLLIAYLAQRLPGVATEADALTALRSRRPGSWDDAVHAPLGAGDGGLIGYAEAAYRPLGLEEAGDGYYGAVNYREAGPGGLLGRWGPCRYVPRPRRFGHDHRYASLWNGPNLD